jgi:hypothetical protein
VSEALGEAGERRAHAKDAEDDEEHDLEEVPVAVVGDLEEHKLAGPEGVHGLPTPEILLNEHESRGGVPKV